jgi:hypothetical protein
MHDFVDKTLIQKLRTQSVGGVIRFFAQNLYLQSWHLALWLILKTKVIHRDIEFISTKLRTMHKKDMPIVLITSCLRVSKFPLSYTPIRSVFSEEVRIAQTKQSIDSVLQIFPNSEIFLIDISNVEETLLKQLELNQNVRAVQINSRIARYLSKSPYKGLGEAYITLAVLKICKGENLDFFKLSGRYTLTPRAKEILPIRDILFKTLNQTAVTIAYGIGNQSIKEAWCDYLTKNLTLLAKGVSIEQVFYSFTIGRNLQESPSLHAEGLISINGSYTSF